jgi:hypothetical protein
MGFEVTTIPETIEKIKEQARSSWSGGEGERRAERVEKFVTGLLENYSSNLDISELEILRSLEKRRDYSAINFYQEANFPLLENVTVFETKKDFIERFPSRKFRCPACGGISSDPYECNSGEFINGDDKKVCDWKSWGLFGTLGKGFKVTIKEGFLEHPVVDDIFPPIELEMESGEEVDNDQK